VDETAREIESLAQDTIAWNAASERAQQATQVQAELDARGEGLRHQLHSVLDRLVLGVQQRRLRVTVLARSLPAESVDRAVAGGRDNPSGRAWR